MLAAEAERAGCLQLQLQLITKEDRNLWCSSSVCFCVCSGRDAGAGYWQRLEPSRSKLCGIGHAVV
jgi:hypothetical protein